MLACPASRVLCEGVPEQQENEHMRRGTALHKCMELLIENGGGDPAEFENAVIEGHLITAEDCEAVKQAWDGFTEQPWRGGGLVETVVQFPGVDGSFGTVDVLGTVDDGTPVVLDWKFGKGVQVWPDENAQLMFYAVSAMHTEPLHVLFHNKYVVKLVIVQPNDQGLPVWREWSTDTVALFDFAMRLTEAVTQGLSGGFRTGDHCRWCPANRLCPTLTNAAHDPEPLDDLELHQLANHLSKLPGLEKWMQEVRAKAHEVLENGQQIPGYKLVNKQSRRAWTQPEGRVAARLITLGLDPNEALDTKVVSPAKAEKLLGSLDKMIDLYENRSHGTTVVPDSDRRNAVDTSKAALERLAKQHGKR